MRAIILSLEAYARNLIANEAYLLPRAQVADVVTPQRETKSFNVPPRRSSHFTSIFQAGHHLPYDLAAKTNLIPFDSRLGSIYECSTSVDRLPSNIVFKGSVSALVDAPGGRDIDATYGQQRTAGKKKRRSEHNRKAAAVKNIATTA